MTDTIADETMHVSVREARLFTDRLLMLTGLDLGLVSGVREFILNAELVGAGGFQFVHDHVLGLADIPRPHLNVERRGDVTSIDGAGQFAAFLGPLLLDLVTLEALRSGNAAFDVANVRYPALLSAIAPMANRRGVMTTVIVPESGALEATVGSGSTARPALIGRLNPQADATNGRTLILATATGAPHRPTGTPAESGIGVELWNALNDGFEVNAELWWRLYHRSNDALTRTSTVSRTHTGADTTLEVTW